VALLAEKGGGHGAIDSARHSHDNPAVWHGYGKLSKNAHSREGAWSLDSETLAHRAVDVLSDRQALDIALIDVSRTATFTDYFVIATAQSPLQFSALAEYLEKDLKPQGHDLRHREGTARSGWMLLDFGGMIVHIFSPDQRAFYRLEELWGKTNPVVRFTG